MQGSFFLSVTAPDSRAGPVRFTFPEQDSERSTVEQDNRVSVIRKLTAQAARNVVTH